MDQFEKILLQMQRLFRQISNSDASWSGTKSCGTFTKFWLLILFVFEIFSYMRFIRIYRNFLLISYCCLLELNLIVYYHSKQSCNLFFIQRVTSFSLWHHLSIQRKISFNFIGSLTQWNRWCTEYVSDYEVPCRERLRISKYIDLCRCET